MQIVDARSLDTKRSAGGTIQRFCDLQSGQSFLIADGLTAEPVRGVLDHEVVILMAVDTTEARGKQAMDRNPEWVGRLTFPTRDVAATPPSTTDAEANELRQGRNGLEVQSEQVDLTADARDRNPQSP